MAVDKQFGDVKDLKLASDGIMRIKWAAREMPVIGQIRERFSKEKPFDGVRISGCLHITSETANLAIALKEGGADVVMCASNPLSTQDDVAAALVEEWGIPVFAIKGETNETYYSHIGSAVDHRPQITLDDGADLVATIHQEKQKVIDEVIGGTEETTTGVIRLRSLSREGKLRYPIISVNDADTKHLFDNRYGTGQSTIDGITRATNVLWAGKRVVVVGYGWCGRGVAERSRGLGGHVIVTEVNPVRALQAVMDGFEVMPINDACPQGDIFVTVTGDINVIDRRHFEIMKDGALVANSGHFNVELNLEGLTEMSKSTSKARPYVQEYLLHNGRRIFVLAEGRLVNLSAAEGHPSSVMDMSFANQALCAEYLTQLQHKLDPAVYPVPEDIDLTVGRMKLDSMGVKIDTLTKEQETYLQSWTIGT